MCRGSNGVKVHVKQRLRRRIYTRSVSKAVQRPSGPIITTVVFNRSILDPRTGACLKSHLTRALPLSLTLQGITMLTIPAPNTGRLGAEVAMLAEGLAAEPMGVEDARVEDPIEEI